MSEAAAEQPDPQRRKAVLFEVLAVAAIAIIPSAFSWLSRGTSSSVTRGRFVFSSVVQDLLHTLGVVVLLAFVIWNSNDPPSKFGLSKPKWGHDLPLLVLAFVVMLVTRDGVNLLLNGRIQHFLPVGAHILAGQAITPALVFGLALAAIAVLASAFRQELLIRGYLIPRLREVFGNAPAAILVSAVLFSSWHMYQGLFGVLHTLADGLILGYIFAKTGRLWPLVLAHFLYNTVIELT